MKERIGGRTVSKELADSLEPDYTPVEKGKYPMVIVRELTYKKSPRTGNFYAQLTLKHATPELKQKGIVTMNFTQNEVGDSLFYNFLKAIGVPKENLVGSSWAGTQVDKAASIVAGGEEVSIKGREIVVGLKIKESTDGYPAKNEVSYFEK